MSVDADDLSAVVRYALESTRATATCPFHLDVTVRVGDDAAGSHAWGRARSVHRVEAVTSPRASGRIKPVEFSL